MDTYFSVQYGCVKCGRCVRVCREMGEGFLVGGRDIGPVPTSDYVPCHHCEGFRQSSTPCQSVCHYDAIRISRY